MQEERCTGSRSSGSSINNGRHMNCFQIPPGTVLTAKYTTTEDRVIECLPQHFLSLRSFSLMLFDGFRHASHDGIIKVSLSHPCVCMSVDHVPYHRLLFVFVV